MSSQCQQIAGRVLTLVVIIVIPVKKHWAPCFQLEVINFCVNACGGVRWQCGEAEWWQAHTRAVQRGKAAVRQQGVSPSKQKRVRVFVCARVLARVCPRVRAAESDATAHGSVSPPLSLSLSSFPVVILLATLCFIRRRHLYSLDTEARSYPPSP